MPKDGLTFVKMLEMINEGKGWDSLPLDTTEEMIYKSEFEEILYDVTMDDRRINRLWMKLESFGYLGFRIFEETKYTDKGIFNVRKLREKLGLICPKENPVVISEDEVAEASQ